MGRPRKNPEYNPEEQFQKMLEDVKDAYENADSLRSLASELNMTLLKLRKLLITAGIFTSDICMEVNQLHEQGKTIPEIMKITGLSRASVHSYLPYVRGIYNTEELSLDAKRCRMYRERMERVRNLQLNPIPKRLWETLVIFEDYPFRRETNELFRYQVSEVGKNPKKLFFKNGEHEWVLEWKEIRKGLKEGTENLYIKAIFNRFGLEDSSK